MRNQRWTWLGPICNKKRACSNYYSPNWYAMYETLRLPKDRWETADELWLEHYGEQPPKLVDGAGETIHALRTRGYRLGIVTSGTERRVTREIQQLGLTSTFEALICNEHIANKKPHPEGLEKAMRLLVCAKEVCSYVGDAPEDVRMGKNAGLMTVAVPSAYPTSHNLLSEHPDIHIGIDRRVIASLLTVPSTVQSAVGANTP